MDGSTTGGMDLGDVILAIKGQMGYDRLSDTVGGTPTGSRLHQIVKGSEGPPLWTADGEPLNPAGTSRRLRAVPELTTLFGIRRLTGLAWDQLLVAAARSCGVVIPAHVPKLVALIPAEAAYLDDAEVAELLRTIRFAAQRAKARHGGPDSHATGRQHQDG